MTGSGDVESELKSTVYKLLKNHCNKKIFVRKELEEMDKYRWMLNGVYIHKKLQTKQANEDLQAKNVQTNNSKMTHEALIDETSCIFPESLIESMTKPLKRRGRKRTQPICSPSTSCSSPKSQRVN